MACSGECFSLVLWGKKCVSACWLLDNWGSLFISVAFKHTDLRQGKGEAEGGVYHILAPALILLNTLSIDSSLFLPCTRIGRQLLCRDLKLYFQPSDL